MFAKIILPVVLHERYLVHEDHKPAFEILGVFRLVSISKIGTTLDLSVITSYSPLNSLLK